MYPELHLIIGSVRLSLSMHALAVLAGVVCGATLAGWRTRERTSTLLAVAVVALVGLASARAWSLVLHGGPGGLASTGGIAAGLAATWLGAQVMRRPAAVLLDAIAPAGLLALAIGRVGCFLAGCCYGRPTTFVWGVVFPEVGPPARHPLQLYSAVGDLALLLLLPRRDAPTGTAFRRLAAGFALLRFLLERLRDPATTDRLPGGWLTLPQAACLLLLAAALCLRPLGPSTMPPSPEDSAAWRTRKR